jgi:hydrogenase maturation protein HypF
VELVGVQHHHAHLAACLAEHGMTGPAVGAIYDGVGLGTDGRAWGGEILLGDLRSFARIGHLRPVALPGGDRAAREPWRMACAWLVAVEGAVPAIPPRMRVDPERWEAVARMALTGFAAPPTTSMGRLFDAVAALCGLRPVTTYEGQAAIELEALARVADTGSYPLGAGLDARELIAAVARDAARGVSTGEISARFHRAVAGATAEACAASGADTAVLSGGVFQNRLLLAWTIERLEALGLRVLVPERVPANDGGISFGQAAVAAALSRAGSAAPPRRCRPDR